MASSNTLSDKFKKVFKTSLRIEAKTISVRTLTNERNLNRINFTPYYQRNYVWDKRKQSFFIESVILGTEIPPLIFFKSGLKVEVIDGRQRFETIKRFIEGDITLNAKGLMTLFDLARKNYIKLSDEERSSFLEANIRIFEFEIINEPDLEPEVEDMIKREIFRRYNTGITPLTSSEVDNAKYDNDNFTSFVRKSLKSDKGLLDTMSYLFSSTENKTLEGDANIGNSLRRFFVIEKFPISKFASGNERKEIIDILYDFSFSHNQDLALFEFETLCEQLKEVKRVVEMLELKDRRLRNRFIAECLVWFLRVAKKEGIVVNLAVNINFLEAELLKVIEIFENPNHHYYSSIISRFNVFAGLFNKLYNYDISIYVRDVAFTKDLREKVKTERSTDIKAKELSSLRIAKPAPISTPIDEILEDVGSHNYLLRPSYQRQERISELKASAIIESILLGINLPPLFIYKDKNNTKEVIDGQQRLLSILGFMGKEYRDEKGIMSPANLNRFKLKGLKILTELNGDRFTDLSLDLREKLIDFTLDIIIIDEKLNSHFEPTDLFIRLNNKPYPIESNSFEMWNSTVNSTITQKIKNIVTEHGSWFFAKDISNFQKRTDRMENEELITILSYLALMINIDREFPKIIGFFSRKDKISCRLKNKGALSDYLAKLSIDVVGLNAFVTKIDETNQLINELKSILNPYDLKISLNEILDVKNSNTYKRSFQDFYVIWIYILRTKMDNKQTLLPVILVELKEVLTKFKNLESLLVDDEYLIDFLSLLKLNPDLFLKKG